MRNPRWFFEDLDAFMYAQLPSGHWAGRTLYGVFRTITVFPKGEYPKGRFKHERCVRASKKHSIQYWDSF